MKKILGAILAFAMIISVCPFAFATETNAEKQNEGYNYVFTKEVYGADTDVSMSELAAKEFSDVDTSKSNPWRPAAHAYIGTTKGTSNGVYINSDRVNGDTVYALELKVEEGGTFVPSFTYYAKMDSSIVDMYLVKSGVTSGNINTSAFEFGDVSGKHNGALLTFTSGITEEKDGVYILADDLPLFASTSADMTENFDNRKISIDGNASYFLIIRVVGKNPEYAGSYLDTYLKSFSLSPVAEEVTYKLTDEVLDGSNIAREDLVNLTADSFSDKTSATWRYAGDCNITNAYAFNGLNILTAPVRADDKDGCAVIGLDVKRSGTYIPKLGYTLRESAPVVDAYLVKADVVSNGITTDTFGIGKTDVYNYLSKLDDEYKLGEVDMYSSSDAELTTPFASRELTAGKYYLFIRTVGKNDAFKALSGSYIYITLKSFTLTPTDGEDSDELTSLSLSASSSEILVGNTVSLTATANFSVSGDRVLTEGVTYKSSDENVASVSDKGVVTGIKTGTVEISAKVSGTEISDTVEISVKDIPRATREVTYKFDRGAYGSLENVSMAELAAKKLSDVDASVSDPWRPASHAYIGVTNATSQGVYINSDRVNGDTVYALELEVKEGGRYFPSLEYIAQPDAPTVDIFLAKKGVSSGNINTSAFEFGDASGKHNGALLTFASAIAAESEGIYILKRGLDMYAPEEIAIVEKFGKCELVLENNTSYFLIFRVVGKNPTYSGTYMDTVLASFNLKPPVGEFGSAKLSVKGLIGEDDPMANMTERELQFKLFDDIGISFDEVDESKLSVEYFSEDESVATVSETGIITAHNNGTVKIKAEITYDGITKSAEYNLIVAPSGRNLMEHLNADFSEDRWVWDSQRNDAKPENPPFFHTGIVTESKDGNENNRALAFTFNPEVPMPEAISAVFLQNNAYRVELEPGRLYQLTFKVKTDITKPSDGEYPEMRNAIYAYNNPKGASGSDIAAVSGRSTNLFGIEGWQEIYSDWNEFSVPIVAPIDYSGELLYVSPRLDLYMPPLSVGKTGYSGAILMDDFELREVGFAGVEMEVRGDLSSGAASFNVLSKPYTTLGHYISISDTAIQKCLDISASDENVVSNFRKPVAAESSGRAIAPSSEAMCGGKNGTTEINATITLNGISRTGNTSVTTSGYDMKLLYAEAKTEQESVEVGNSTKLLARGFMSDGTEADMTNGRVIYESLTTDIVSIDESGKIETLRAGKGKLAATFILGGSSAYAETEVTVTDSSAIISAELSAPETVGYLRDERLVLTGEMQSGYAADFTNADINWIIECNPVGGVSITENNMIFGDIKGANAKIKAEITMGAATVMTNEIEITVGDTDLRDFTINFGGISEKEITDVTIEKYGWALDTENTHSSALTSHLMNDYVYALTNGVDHDFVVDFKAPYTGNFAPVFVANSLNGYGSENSYLYIDGVYVGEYCFYGNNLAPKNMRPIYLEAGIHKFTLRPVKEKTVALNYYQYPASIRFAAISSLPGTKEIITGKNEYEISAGNTAELNAKLKMTDGFVYEWQKMRNNEADPFAFIEYISGDASVATVDENGTITAIGEGNTDITVKVTLNGIESTKIIFVSVLPAGSVTTDEMLASVEIEAPHFVMNPGLSGMQLTAVGKNSKGEKLDITDAEVFWTTEDNSVVSVSENGYVTPNGIGSAKIVVTVTKDEIEKSTECYVSVREGKVGRTYYTDEMVAAAQENIEKYNWARSESKAAIESAEKYIGLENELWEIVPGEGVPRSITVGYRSDPDRYTCRYCGIDLNQSHGGYGWISNPIVRPWKIQCPDCKRQFPSNDFGSFYELGRDEKGIFSRELALERHEEMFGGTYGVGYLKNTLYPEIGTEDCKVKLGGNETSEKWGVDDGFGYDTGRVYTNGTREVHTYIAYYNHFGLWTNRGTNAGIISDALNSLSKAYMFTGDKKYGRAGAILLDRVADVYPGYDLRPYLPDFSNSDGGSRAGKIIGRIWEVDLVRTFSTAYDAFFPMYDDAEVISFLSAKAEKYNSTEINDKSTPEKIRKNIEDGILRESFREVKNASLLGNFGAHQSAIGTAAIVLDTHPDTDEMLDWLFAYSETDHATYNTGGEINKRLINDVSRDGQGNESGPGYNRIWVTETTEVADVLAKYDEYEGANLYENPKFIGMIKSYAPLTLVRRGLAPIADSGGAAMFSRLPDSTDVMINAFKETKDIEIAQHLYFVRDGNLDNLHYDIFTKNPESLGKDIEEIIDTHGEYNYDKSAMFTGYGFVALRDGTLHKSSNADIRDTQRDFWMYFGGAQSHTHADKLNLGIEAYGIPLTTDLGYPETAGSDPNRYQWQGATISHNTVVVNEKSQDTARYSGVPLHYDGDDGRVKVVDIDAPVMYASTDEYRRTIVMVDFDDEISYGIDFFKILGGNDHLYSFHACSEENPEVSDGINLKEQLTGSYASVSVPYGPDPWSITGNNDAVLKYPVGYSWLFNVNRADNPGKGEFYVDFKIKDYWKQSRNAKQDIHLRMTMVNDWEADEITLADGMPPRTNDILAGVDHLEYMLVRRKGRDLNTLFTTVIEPYDGERYIKNIENVPITVVSGTPGKNELAKAVRVELIDGRVDYIVYAQNNSVTYNVGDMFEFRGFVGVWSTDKTGVNIYSYVNDGEMIGNDVAKIENLDASIEGKILDFERELSFENWIDAEFDREMTQIEANKLSGHIMNVERDTLGNSSYVIESVEMTDATHGRIKLGNVTLISGFVDYKNEELGYQYEVAEGKNFNIPMSYEENPAPVFDAMPENITAGAGSSVSLKVNATSSEDTEVFYKSRILPRGASFDTETATFIWKPSSSQIGENLVAIDAVDEFGRITTQYFTITVYGSTSSGPAGGGGGENTIPAKPETSDKGEETKPSVPETEKARFIDLGSHAWAEDAINSLADEGIIRGTSENTFSPANNITRADFAILLVRAFKLTSDNVENFTDVNAGDYFASELAIARNTGIVSGIGDNKYAPRNTITRQDMMVIVYRTLMKFEVDLVGRAAPGTPDYDDFAEVADYAKDAVKALITNGLVNGKNGKIAPTDNTTRAEVAVLLKRILDYTGK